MSQAKAKPITPSRSCVCALQAAARGSIARAIQVHLDAAETLTALLDELDGDAECEPSLGSNESRVGGTDWSQPLEGNDDREVQCEDEGADEGGGRGLE